MPTCKRCGKRKLFMRLYYDGVCSDCAEIITAKKAAERRAYQEAHKKEKQPSRAATPSTSADSETKAETHKWTVEKALHIMHAPYNVLDEQQVKKREQAYNIILEERQKQIAAIHPPETLTPTDVTLEPKEILFLWYINGKKVIAPEIGVYWILQYGLRNYQALIQKLWDGGFLTTAPVFDSLSKLKNSQLKEILDDYAIRSTGKKAELVERIMDNIPPQVVNDLYKRFSVFSTTPYGDAILQENEIFVLHHRGDTRTAGLSLEDIQYVNHLFPEATARDKLEMAFLMANDARMRHYITMEPKSLEQIVNEHPEWDFEALWHKS